MIDYLFLFVKLLIGFVITILHLNYNGKTQISQMNAIDLIGNFILGGVIGGVIYNPAIPFHTYIICLVLGVFLINILNWLVKKISLFRAFAIGDPIILINDGRFCIDAIKDKKNKIDIHNISANLRILGYFSFDIIKFLQIEPNGQLSVIAKEKEELLPAVILMVNGIACSPELEKLEKSEDWLMQQVTKNGISDFEKVYLIEFYNNELNIVLNDGSSKNHIQL